MVRLVTRYRHLLLLLIYPLVGWGFQFCEATVTTARYVMVWPAVDYAIPFVPWMVGPYVFWYALVAWPFLWLGFRDRTAFVRYSLFLYLGMTTAFVFYLLFPNGQPLRPGLDALPPGWDGALLRWIYTHDTPLNVNPSIHVIDTLAVWFALADDQTGTPRGILRVVLAVVCLAVIASTVLVKQHSILDVFGGLGVSAFWGAILYRRPRFFFPSRRS